MSAFYNENDPKAAAWLRELIKAGLIAPGIVDERSISDISPTDLHGFTQCHFFAGIGGWSYALRLAGIPDSVPVWTGSCPCQPFSAAGKQEGTKDERHLWPSFARLIDALRPPTVFGEQVASKAGREWLAGVFADLEDLGYCRAAADLCAAGVGAPHIRQRLYWVANTSGERFDGGAGMPRTNGRRLIEASCQLGGMADTESERRNGRQNDKDGGRRQFASGHHGEAGRLGDTDSAGPQPRRQTTAPNGYGCSALADGGAGHMANPAGEGSLSSAHAGIYRGEEGSRTRDGEPERCGAARRLAHANGGQCGNGGLQPGGQHRQQQEDGSAMRLEHTSSDGRKQRRTESSRWSASGGCSAWHSELLPCTDGKARRIEPGSFPLANGIPARVGLLRGYGNAIVPQVAAEFVQAFYEALSQC